MGVATTYNPVASADSFATVAIGASEPAALPILVSRFNAFLLAAGLAAGSAFSADPAPGTTAQPAPAPAPAGLAPDTVVTPLRDAPSVPGAPGAPVSGPVPIPDVPIAHIALILPLSSPTLGRVSEAVRQGFFAAHEAAGRNAIAVRMTATIDDGPSLLPACLSAQRTGAVLVVTGLTRDGATAVAKSDCPRQPTLLLNQPLDGEPPMNVFSVSLSLEQEARQAALLAVNDGWHSAIVIAGASALARRVQDAFEREWVRSAGELRAKIVFTGGVEEAPAIKERIAPINAQIVFFALDQAAARAVRPYVSAALPIYATSLSVDPRAEATVNVDLQGVRYLDMPWFVQPDHPAVMAYPRPREAMAVEQERLYALGIDAYRLADHLLRPEERARPLDGVTGKLTLEPGNQFARTLTPAEVDGGRAVATKLTP